jgi:hypothetical protein
MMWALTVKADWTRASVDASKDSTATPLKLSSVMKDIVRSPRKQYAV